MLSREGHVNNKLLWRCGWHYFRFPHSFAHKTWCEGSRNLRCTGNGIQRLAQLWARWPEAPQEAPAALAFCCPRGRQLCFCPTWLGAPSHRSWWTQLTLHLLLHCALWSGALTVFTWVRWFNISEWNAKIKTKLLLWHSTIIFHT
jgi:hypothetical protein